MAKPEDLDLADGGQAKGGSSKLLMIIIIILLSLILLGGAVFGTLYATGFFSGDHSGDEVVEQEEPEEEEKGPAVYLPMEPPFVVNFDGEGKARFLQITVELMNRDEPQLTAAQLHMPAIRNQLMLLFSSQNYSAISTVEGKEALRAEALTTIQTILEEEMDDPVVENIYFTSFVMQ